MLLQLAPLVVKERRVTFSKIDDYSTIDFIAYNDNEFQI